MKRLLIAAVVGLVAVAVVASLHVSVSTPVTFAGPITPTGWRPPTCGSGSGITATGSGLLYQCASVASGTGTASTLPKWINSSGALGSSSITDNGSTVLTSENFEASGNVQGDSDATIGGELTVQGGASVSGGAVAIDTTGGAVSIGPSAAVTGTQIVDIEAGSASNPDGIFIAANSTNGAPVSIGSTTSGAVLLESGATIKIDGQRIVTRATGTPSISCTSGTATCATTCSDASGIYNLSGAQGCTITFANAYASTPACVFALGSSSAVGWVAIQAQGTSSVKFSPENSTGFTGVTASVNYHCFGTN